MYRRGAPRPHRRSPRRLRRDARAQGSARPLRVDDDLLACIWVATYAALGLWLSAAIPFAYQIASVGGLAYLARTGRVAGLCRAQLAMMLMLPLLLQWNDAARSPT